MSVEQVQLETTDGRMGVHIYSAEGAGRPWPAVVMYMDAFGIRPDLLGMAERLASNGYVVAVPNLYYRTPFAPFDPKAVAAEGPERDRFKGMIASIDRAKVMGDTQAVLDSLDRKSTVRRGTFAAVGYCMGGGYALGAAGTFPDRCRVAASFHGGSLATDKADSPHRLAASMKARVYIGAAEHDATFPPDQAARLDEALTTAGVAHTIETYAGAKHGFAVTGHLVYDRGASELHWQRLLQLLKESL
jgi:carboxymethylenebutenolidase